MMAMAKKWMKLAHLAGKLGLQVDGQGSRILVRTGKSNRSVGLYLSEDGTAYRSDVDLSITTTIRTVAQAKQVLGIDQ